MIFVRRIQWMVLITTLFILYLSFIKPNECLGSHSNKYMINDSRTVIVKDESITSEGDLMTNSVKCIALSLAGDIVFYNQNRDSLPKRINDTVSYPGGEVALQQFLFNNNIFNSSKSEYSIEGIVVLRLSIDSDGYVNNKNIVRSIGGDIDEEALRLAGLLVFNPATDSIGQAINSEYFLKVYFYWRMKEVVIRDIAISVEIDEFEKLYYRNGPASFPGGKRKMKQYFKENIVYPESINEEKIEGKVKLLICLNYYGYISVVQVINSSDHRLNEEAIKLVKSVKRWKTEIRNDKPDFNSFLIADVKFKKP